MVCLQLWHRVFWGHVSKVQLLLWPAWLGWFNHLEKHSNKFFWGYGCCWGSRFSLCIFDKLRWITVWLQGCMNISILAFRSYPFYSLSKEFVYLSLQDVLIGIISSECPLLNYFLLIAKLFLWDCRRSQILPSLAGFKRKIKIKFETEKYICTKNNTLDKFIKKWGTVCPV